MAMNADTQSKDERSTLPTITQSMLDMRPAALFHDMDFHEFVLSSFELVVNIFFISGYG